MNTRPRYTLLVLVLVVLAITVTAALVSGCNKPAASTDTVAPAATATVGAAYTCPMHPEVTSDKPGQCPKCNMALVKKAK